MSKLTTAFLAWVLEAIENEFDYIAIGSDDTAESEEDTALGTEITTNGGARALALTDITDGVLTISKEFEATGALTVNEAGVFNASSEGIMMVRGVVDTEITLANGQFLEVTFTLEVEEGVA